MTTHRPPHYALATAPVPDPATKDRPRPHPAARETLPVPVAANRAAPSRLALGTDPHEDHTSEAAPHDIAPGERIAEYEVIRALGHGGMGVVYLARDLRLGRLVAIKFLARDQARVNQRFQHEARATARCRHENIVVIYDVGEHKDRPYMVLEYLEGQTLKQVVEHHTEVTKGPRPGTEARTPLATERVLAVMIPVVRALVRAHEAGIVHRDLKPANIMLTGDGTIKVLDFGIAKLHADARREPGASHGSSSDINAGAIMGTIAYMSPEQLEGAHVDHRSDLWAVGVMLFEMVMGRHPAGSLSPADLFTLTDLEVPIASVRELRPELGPLAGIIDRCLIKDREHRIADAGELLRDMEAVAAEHRAPTLEHGRDPFTGLAAFQRGDAHRFFGREREIAGILARLPSQPLIVVAGPTGLGKSSLVRAGVIPALERSGEGWDAHVMRPGRQPIYALVDMLAHYTRGATDTGGTGRLDATPAAEQHRRILAEPGRVGAALRAHAHKKRRRLLLFVDQFEELFTLTTDPDEVRAFIACIESVADDVSSPLRVMVSVRSDFLYRTAEFRSFAQQVSAGMFFVPPLGRDALRDALEKPVHNAGYAFESPAVVEDMLDHVVAAPGALPLLQFAAAQLWAQRDTRARLLTEDSYRAMGGLAGTLAGHADRVLAGLSVAETELARALLLRLVTPERTRDVVDIRELHGLWPTPEAGEALIQRLVEARLLVIEGAGASQRTVELVHESLITSWPRLVRWLDDSREDSAFLARLRSAVAAWERSGRSDGLLWRGEAATEARLWMQRHGAVLSDAERAYMAAVLALARRVLRLKRAALAASMVFLTCLALAALWAKQNSDAKTREVTEKVELLRAQEERLQDSLASETRSKKSAEEQRDKAEKLTKDLKQAVLEEQRATAEATRARVAEQRAKDRVKGSLRRVQRSREQLAHALDRETLARQHETRAKERAENAEKEARDAEVRERDARERLQAIIERANGGPLYGALSH